MSARSYFSSAERKRIFRDSGVARSEYPIEPVRGYWTEPDAERLRSFLREMILDGVSLVVVCRRNRLPLLVVMNAFLKYLPTEWAAYNAARKEGLKEVVLEELVSRLGVTMADYYDDSGQFLGFSGLSRSQKEAIESFESEGPNCKLKLSSRKDAIVLLGKELGMFKNRIEHSGKIDLNKVLEEIDSSES